MTSVSSRLAGLVAVALAAATGLVGVSAEPAAAAQCSGSGVSVVVDFGSLGGGVQKGCDTSGANRSADKVFPAAGFPLMYAAREPGFVCRVKNTPTSDPCGNASPTNAYWGLFWSNGKSGKWTYSSSGVGGTSVPNGGFLAFSWQNGGDRDWPRAAPVRSKQASTPKPQPTKAATKSPEKVRAPQPESRSGSGSTAAKAPEEATPEQPTKTQGASGASPQKKAAKAKRARASKRARARASASPSARSSASQSAAADPSDEASPDVTSAKPVDSAFAPDQEQNGLPVWVPVLVVLALAGAAGGTAWWRRRAGAP